MTKKITILILLLLFVAVTAAKADPVVKQFYFKKETTLPYPGIHTLRFSLWDAETDGTMVWSEEKLVSLTKSFIKTYLGDTNTLDGVVFSQQLWVQVEKKKGDGTYRIIGERDILGMVPYALWSETSGVKLESQYKGGTTTTNRTTADRFTAWNYATSTPGLYMIIMELGGVRNSTANTYVQFQLYNETTNSIIDPPPDSIYLWWDYFMTSANTNYPISRTFIWNKQGTTLETIGIRWKVTAGTATVVDFSTDGWTLSIKALRLGG
jgi:hypothetical protein